MDRRASEVECAFYVSWPSICVNVTVLRASRTCFNDGTSGPYIEPRDDQRDVGEIENLGTVRQTKSPKLGGRPKYVYKSFPVARADLRAPRKADEVGMSIITEPIVQVFAGLDDKWLYEVPGLVCAVS